jgi:hypothetical protein
MPAPAENQLDRAFVTIPYAELHALWEAGHTKPPPAPEKPPVSYVIYRADCELHLGERTSTLKAQFDLELLEAKWQPIALIGGPDVRLEKAEAPKGTVIAQDGYQFLGKEPGKFTATLDLLASGIHAITGGEPLKLNLPAASVKTLRVSGIPKGTELRVNGRAAGEAADGVVTISLPGDAGLATLELSAPRPEQPVTPSHWHTQMQTFVRPAEARLEFLSHLALHAEEGSGLEGSLLLPANAASITVTTDDLAEWTQARAEDGRRALRLRWKTRDQLDREVALSYTTPQSPLADEWKLSAPVAADDPDAAQFYAIVPADGLELKGEAIRPAVGALRLPSWIREKLAGASFVVAEGGSQLALQAHWLATVDTAEAIVSNAKGQLRLVGDGSTQTDISYVVAHEAPLSWQLELPQGVQILSCSVDGKATRPIQRNAQAVELTLPTPAVRAKGTTVALSYAAKTDRLDAVSGRVALELPRTALFIDRLDWTVAMPDVFEVTAIEGNLSIAPPEGPSAAAAAPSLVQLRKDLCRGERPAIELFYQRRLPEK